MEWTKGIISGYILELPNGTATISKCHLTDSENRIIQEWMWNAWTPDDMIGSGYCDTIEEAKVYTEALLNAALTLREKQDLPVIDWENAPEKAVCHTNDKNGKGFFYNYVPTPRVMIDAWSYIIQEYEYGIDMPAFSNDGWKQTLQMRPKKEK